jgi:acylphosphatase
VTGASSRDGRARIAATIRWQVQGVGFRWFVVRHAGQLGLAGWVANASDGSVVLEAEGDRAALDRLLQLVREGPPGAVVQGVSSSDLRATGDESRFAVRSQAHRGD